MYILLDKIQSQWRHKSWLLALSFLLLSSFGGYAQLSPYDLNRPVGWGTIQKTPTGGGQTPYSVTVRTANDLKYWLNASGKRIIYIKDTIRIDKCISLKVVDKTILGLPGSCLYNPHRTDSTGIMQLKRGSNNVILRNLVFKSAGSYDIDGGDNLTLTGAENIWVDHCDFQDGVDGNFDCNKESDAISVTWCRFRYLIPPKPGGPGGADDHRLSNLWCSSELDSLDRGKLRTTFMYCWWDEGCRDRMPFARYAKIHVLNCLYTSRVSGCCVCTGVEANIKVDRCAFYNTKRPYRNASTQEQPSTADFDGCYFQNSPYTQAEGYSFNPYQYYELLEGIPSEKVYEVVADSLYGAGATLTVVENQGVISSCDERVFTEEEMQQIDYYRLDGIQTPRLEPGLNIVRYRTKDNGYISRKIWYNQ